MADKLAVPVLPTIIVMGDGVELSPHVTVPVRVSPGIPIQATVPVTICPVCAFAGLTSSEQLGGAGVTVTTILEGVTLPILPSVLS